MTSTSKEKEFALTADRLRALLIYDPQSGTFTNRTSRGRAWAGQVAGTVDPRGYRRIIVDGRQYLGHRLAWLYVHGEWPPSDLDHENNRPGHDWIDNLRPATDSQNLANSRRRQDNTSGLKGVSYYRRNGTWRAQISYRGKIRHLGYYSTPEAAHAAYAASATELFGGFSNDGK